MTIVRFCYSFFRRLRSDAHYDPVRDWLMLITFSALILVSVVVWNIWTFDTVARGGVIGSVATSTTSVFSSSSLDAIHTVFVNRAEEEAKYVTGAYRYADPSQ